MGSTPFQRTIKELIRDSSIGRALERRERRAIRERQRAAKDAECSCPPEHTVSKLGHCRSCPWSRALRSATDHAFHPNKEHLAVPRTLRQASQQVVQAPAQLYICGGDICGDGRPHDFGWANYCDEWEETGVCRCGLRQIDHDLLRAE